MTIIADSGSTKTTWMEVASGNKIVTEGLNPHFTTDETFLAACDEVRQQFSILNSHFSIFFYGAGCGNLKQQKRVASLLANAFGTNDVHVETDMLGACRAVSGNTASLVGILGTGSNACYYDGQKIEYQPLSTGYILGDHGSANHIGRRILQDYLSGSMPSNLIPRFQKAYPMTYSEFMDAVYHQPTPNRFLASLARFAVDNINDDYCSSEILINLYEWYNYQVDNLRKVTHCDVLNLVGGFAARIRHLLDIVAKDKGLTIKNVAADPIDGLREYHLKQNTL